jgi:hypothetical protein
LFRRSLKQRDCQAATAIQSLSEDNAQVQPGGWTVGALISSHSLASESHFKPSRRMQVIAPLKCFLGQYILAGPDSRKEPQNIDIRWPRCRPAITLRYGIHRNVRRANNDNNFLIEHINAY